MPITLSKLKFWETFYRYSVLLEQSVQVIEGGTYFNLFLHGHHSGPGRLGIMSKTSLLSIPHQNKRGGLVFEKKSKFLVAPRFA